MIFKRKTRYYQNFLKSVTYISGTCKNVICIPKVIIRINKFEKKIVLRLKLQKQEFLIYIYKTEIIIGIFYD